MSNKLNLSGVSKSFGTNQVLNDISLAINAGEVISFIGASGSGKTTLLRCINLLEQIDNGSIHLDDVEITKLGVDANPIRRRIGIVFQSFNLFPHMSVRRNITLALTEVLGKSKDEASSIASTLLTRFGLSDKIDSYPDRLSGGQQQRVAIARALALNPEVLLLDEITSALDPELVGEVLGKSSDEASSIASTLLTRFGLSDKIDSYPDRLSGGQQQRVAIARALALNPEVLLLDEITSALDPELVGEVLDVVRELKGSGITLLLATHEMGFAKEISDRVCFLADGTVAELGSAEQIFTAPTDARTQQFLQRVISAGRLRG